MPSANWQGTYVSDWGIYNKRAANFGASVIPVYVETGTANMKVQVTRLLGNYSSSQVGLVYRYENDQNYGFAYSGNGAIYLVEVVNGAYAISQSGVPQANWLKLSVVANGSSVKVYTDFNLIITATSNNLLNATKAGLLGSAGTGERFDDFAVYMPQ